MRRTTQRLPEPLSTALLGTDLLTLRPSRRPCRCRSPDNRAGSSSDLPRCISETVTCLSDLASQSYDAYVLKTVSNGPGLSILQAAEAVGVPAINNSRSISFGVVPWGETNG